MRFVQLTVPDDVAVEIQSVLEDEELGYYASPKAEREKYDTIVSFSVETPDVEYPELSNVTAEEVTAETMRDVTVRVEFVHVAVLVEE